jgi:cytochrome c oxidase assembly factor CtaG/cytochrome c2
MARGAAGAMSAPSIGQLAGAWQLDPGLLLSGAAALAAYAWGARRARAWPAHRSACFALGVGAVLAALCSGLDAYADRLLSVHMVQHLVLTLVAAPLLVAGSPVALALRALPRAGRRTLARALRSRPARVVTHPLTTWSLLPAAMLASHLTGIYELALRHPLAHAAEHLAFLGAALLFWLPLLGVEPLPHRPSWVARMLYMLLAMPAMALSGIVLSIDQHVRYPSYLAPARALHVDALADQHMGGAIMWIVGSILAGLLTMLAAWLALVREEQRMQAREARHPSLPLLVLTVAVAAFAAGVTPAQAATQPNGRALFLGSCASCHGFDGSGVRGQGPSLLAAAAQAADFYLRTGRMPLANPSDAPVRAHPQFTDAQIRALTAYVASLGGGRAPPVPRVDPAAGDLATGRHAFTDHCAGCHQVLARGGIVTGAIAPPLQQATPTQIAEAVRIGPYLMPRFTTRQIDRRTLDSIARYVEWAAHRPANEGGWGIGNIGPIPEGLVAWLIAIVALLIVIRLIGERSPE